MIAGRQRRKHHGSGRTYRLVGGSDPFDPQGRPSFQLLQNNQSRALPVYFYAFDLLNRNGEPLVSLAIERRRELLGRLLAAAEDPLRLSPLLRAPSGQVLGAVRKLGLEGVSSSLPPLARYFSARRPEKARLIHPARIFRVSSTNNVMPKAKSARKPNAALMKPVQPDDTLAKIVGSTPLPRSEVTKKIWDYIKKNKLQDAKKKTLINADDALKSVFGGKKQVTMFEMTKHVSGHVK